MTHDLSIILPTYNEAENIEHTIRTIHAFCREAGLDPEIVVVDDSSPDGTAAIAQPFAQRVIVRTERGLSGAVLEGFRQASTEILVVTDADLSHEVSRIPVMVEALQNGYDLVIGSRYMDGGGIEQWPLTRRIISLGATHLARRQFPFITDPVSGFFALKKSVVYGVHLRPEGFKILLDILAFGRYRSVMEVPYVFQNRKSGASKLTVRIIRQFLQQMKRIGGE